MDGSTGSCSSTTTDEIFGLNNAVIDFHSPDLSLQCFRKWSWVEIQGRKLFEGCPLPETVADLVAADGMEDLPGAGPPDPTPGRPRKRRRV